MTRSDAMAQLARWREFSVTLSDNEEATKVKALVRMIMRYRHVGGSEGQKAAERQEARVDELVTSGADYAPYITSVIADVIADGESGEDQYDNAGRLCTALGRLGGDEPRDHLTAFATLPETPDRHYGYKWTRRGALAGLAHLSTTDPVARGILEEVSRQWGLGEVANLVLEELGEDPIETPDTIAKAFVRSELDKEEPDFRAFAHRLQKYSAKERGIAWRHVAAKFYNVYPKSLS